MISILALQKLQPAKGDSQGQGQELDASTWSNCCNGSQVSYDNCCR